MQGSGRPLILGMSYPQITLEGFNPSTKGIFAERQVGKS